MAKTYCPNHKDNTPSLHIYEDGNFCFVCGYFERSDKTGVIKEPEDAKSRINYILQLPQKPVRGLRLRQDNEGYFILWPKLDYYKLRRFSNTGPRYIGPKGHRAPLFLFEGRSRKALILVEGELNAISLKVAYTDHKVDIGSPGSCAELSRHYKEYLRYEYICIIVDKDNPGVGHGLALKQRLLRDKKNVELIAMSPDYNDILVTSGVEGVKKEAEEQGLAL